MMCLRAAVSVLAFVGTAQGFVMNLGPSNRRDAAKFALAGAASVFVARPNRAYAVVKVNKTLGQESFRRIRDARQQLDSVDVPLRSRKFEEVQVGWTITSAVETKDHDLLAAVGSGTGGRI